LSKNYPRTIGKPVTVERLARYQAALDGDDKPFRNTYDKYNESVMSRLATQLRWWRGGCIHCVKELSYSYCVFSKNKLGKLGTLSKVSASPNCRNERLENSAGASQALRVSSQAVATLVPTQARALKHSVSFVGSWLGQFGRERCSVI
jgi:hypothetical protein